jgi:hypothetical protein
MTTQQANEIRELVDKGGWDAVRKHPTLSKIWAKHLRDCQSYTSSTIDK